jgi:Fic family protein
MVELIKSKKGNQIYYYLKHSYREGNRVKSIMTYLGKNKPKNEEKLKKDFMQKFYYNKFLKKIDIIRKNYNKEQKEMPRSAKEKQQETFAIKFTYNTQRIEGSTLTRKETADLLQRGITPSTKPIRDVKEAESHKNLFFEMLDYTKDLNLQIILYWHKKLLEQTKKDIAGKIRNHNVAIARSKFIPPLSTELDFLLKEFFDWYKFNKNKLHPVELAALVHLKFVTIHPFSDGNGRISRIMMNFVLNKYKFPLLDIPYEKRTSYYNALERAQVKKEDSIFTQWFFKRYLEEYKRLL